MPTCRCAAFLDEPLIPYEDDEVTRLIIDTHDAAAFAPVASLTVGEFRDWLLSDAATPRRLSARAGLTPEMAAAVSQADAQSGPDRGCAQCRVVTRFRNTIGLPGRLSMRLQPNHPTDDPKASPPRILDGLLYGCGDAVIGINPATDSADGDRDAARHARRAHASATTSRRSPACSPMSPRRCDAIERGAPVDLVFQSIAGTRGGQRELRHHLALLDEAHEAALSLNRGTVGDNVMYFETGQGSALSADAHHGVDQQTLRGARLRRRAALRPLLVNTVVGFIGPEYLYDGKQIIRAGLEDHFCGKLLGLPMGWTSATPTTRRPIRTTWTRC